MSGFRRQRNIEEIIAPTKPVRTRRTFDNVGCFHCDAPRSCILHESGALQQVKYIQSMYDGNKHYINKHVNCDTKNVIYYIVCNCQHKDGYIGSPKSLGTGFKIMGIS